MKCRNSETEAERNSVETEEGGGRGGVEGRRKERVCASVEK